MSDLVARLRDKHCCDNGCHCDEAAIDLIRNEVRSEALEEAAVVFDRYENDPFTASVVADHLRRMKEAP